MTDRSAPDQTPDDPDDRRFEAASAYVDGVATPEEIALVESDEDVRRAAEALATVRRRLPVGEPPPEETDAHVAAALAEFDRLGAADGAAVADLAAARTRRPWEARMPRSGPSRMFGAVAAAIVLIALVAGVSLLDTGADDAETATSADTAEESAELDATGSGGAADGEAFEDDRGVADAAPAPARLAFADNDALADYVAQELRVAAGADEGAAEPSEPTLDSTTAEQESSAACDPVETAAVGDAPVVAVIPAVVAGESVTAVVTDDGGRRLVVVDDATCAVVDDRTLPD